MWTERLKLRALWDWTQTRSLFSHPASIIGAYKSMPIAILMQAPAITDILKREVAASDNKINIWQPQALICAEI